MRIFMKPWTWKKNTTMHWMKPKSSDCATLCFSGVQIQLHARSSCTSLSTFVALTWLQHKLKKLKEWRHKIYLFFTLLATHSFHNNLFISTQALFRLLLTLKFPWDTVNIYYYFFSWEGLNWKKKKKPSQGSKNHPKTQFNEKSNNKTNSVVHTYGPIYWELLHMSIHTNIH